MKVSAPVQHCTSSPLLAVPVIQSKSKERLLASPRPALSAARLRRSRTRPRRMRSCPSECILGRQGSRPEGSCRQGQGLVRRFHLGTCGLRHLRRVPRAGEGPALCVRRSRGQPDPRVPCLPAPRCPSRWDPIPHRTNHPPPRGQLFLSRSPTTSAPSAIPHLTDHFRMAICHLTDCFRIPVLDTSLISSPRHFLPHLYPLTSGLPCPGPPLSARPKALVF